MRSDKVKQEEKPQSGFSKDLIAALSMPKVELETF